MISSRQSTASGFFNFRDDQGWVLVAALPGSRRGPRRWLRERRASAGERTNERRKST